MLGVGVCTALYSGSNEGCHRLSEQGRVRAVATTGKIKTWIQSLAVKTKKKMDKSDLMKQEIKWCGISHGY